MQKRESNIALLRASQAMQTLLFAVWLMAMPYSASAQGQAFPIAGTPFDATSEWGMSNAFQSTGMYQNAYTISVAAQELENVGWAVDPQATLPISRVSGPPPGGLIGGGEGTEDKPDIGIILPVGDGIWVLLSLVLLLTAYRYIRHRAKRQIAA